MKNYEVDIIVCVTHLYTSRVGLLTKMNSVSTSELSTVSLGKGNFPTPLEPHASTVVHRPPAGDRSVRCQIIQTQFQGPANGAGREEERSRRGRELG